MTNTNNFITMQFSAWEIQFLAFIWFLLGPLVVAEMQTTPGRAVLKKKKNNNNTAHSIIDSGFNVDLFTLTLKFMSAAHLREPLSCILIHF